MNGMQFIRTTQYTVMTMSNTIRAKKATRKRSATAKRCVRRFVVLDTENQWPDVFRNDETVVCGSRESLVEAIRQTTASESLWISHRAARTEELIKTIADHQNERERGPQKFGDLLMLESLKVRMLPPLYGWFNRVIGGTQQFKKLPVEQLVEVLAAPDERRRDVFVGGDLNEELGTLALVRGNLDRLTVPLSLFRPSGRAIPNFSRFALDDYGHTLRFGNYEATSDVVLWEVDPDYRRRAKAKERQQATGFGASLRRLRNQRGLSQSDFPHVSRKTLSRIEKGEVEKPHSITLNRIAETLDVTPNEIESY